MEGSHIINDSNSDDSDDSNDNNDDDQTSVSSFITLNIDQETVEKMTTIVNLVAKFVQLSDNIGLPLRLLDYIIHILENGVDSANTLYSALQIARVTDEQKTQLHEFTQQIANGQILDTGLTHVELFNVLRLVRIINSRSDKIDELVAHMKNVN